MPSQIETFLEVGERKTFAGAIDWPGWCRSGKDEEQALANLIAYGPRYALALGSGGFGFEAPKDPSELRVVERLEGNATTDFGAPNVPLSNDKDPIDDADVERSLAVYRACQGKTSDRRTARRQTLAPALPRAARRLALVGPRLGNRGSGDRVRLHLNLNLRLT